MQELILNDVICSILMRKTMSMLGDFDLNSMQRCTDSFEDIFKQTMLEQEIIFRKQVHELHRLYNVQMTLMKDLAPLALDSSKANAQSLSHETRLPTNSILMVGSTVSLTPELLEGWKGKYQKFLQRPLDLQLLTNQYISPVVNNLPNKGKPGDYLKETMDVNSLHGGDFSDPLELKLSLSLGVAGRKKEDKKRSWYEKKTNACRGTVFDLEESTEETSNEDAKHPSLSFAAKVTYSKRKHDSQVTITSDLITSRTTKKDLSDEIENRSSFVRDSKYCQDWSYTDQEDFLTRKRQFVSYGMGLVDLNEVQLDDLSYRSNDAIMALPSTTSSSGGFSGLISRSGETSCPTTFWRKEIKEFSDNPFEMLRQGDGVKLPLMISNNKDKRTEIQVRNSELSGRSECETRLIGLASVSRPQINLSADLGSHSGNTKNGKDELMLKRPNGPAHGLNPACVAATQLGFERIEEGDSVLLCSDNIHNKIEDEHPDESPASRRSSCVSDNDSSPVRTMQYRIEPNNSDLPASDQFSGTHGRSQVVENLTTEKDQRSSDSNEIKRECCDNKEESAEVDDWVQIAAESIIHISLENSARYHESSTQTLSNESENKGKKQPQRSSDSFELMTLKLTESTADDYSVSSKPFEVGDSERKDFRIKLRRGRRLKDFRREILPGLASLSRHEIREDINILEAVLRSRECRKMTAKMANGESWCTTVRS